MTSAGRPVEATIPIALSLDHRPERPDEASRILATGAKVGHSRLPSGALGTLPRIFTPLQPDVPGLTISRCLGYTSATKWGVLHTPQVFVHRISAADRFLIVATDGLWAVLSSHEAVTIVAGICDSILAGGSASHEFAPRGVGGAAGSYLHQLAAQGGLEAAISDNGGGEGGEETVKVARRPSCAKSGGGHSGSGLSSSSQLCDEDADLLRCAARIDPLQSSAQRDAIPSIAHPMPIQHAAPSPAVEVRLNLCAGGVPVAGCGGGSQQVMDLAESVMPGAVRRARLERRQKTALAASEALVAAAKDRWHRLPPEGSLKKSEGGEASSSYSAAAMAQHDDIAVLVILLEH
jgi:hypothetical protein